MTRTNSPIPESGIAYIKRYLDESEGVPLQDWWDDISMIRGIHQNGESIFYPTQKPERLLQRIIESSSNEGDLVLDA
jgi:adenine specific DNA methylase Mod